MYELSPKDLRAITLMEKYKQDAMATRLKNYHHFLDTLVYLNQTLADTAHEIKSWQKFSETLLMKFFFHGLTLHQINSGLVLSSGYFGDEINGASYVDIPSGRAVLRSKLETFLMYHYIYVNPEDEDVKELRYYSWIYTGLLHRQDFPSKTDFAKVQKQKDQQEMERLKEIIISLPAYRQLTSKQQTSLLKEGSAKTFSHWNKIMEETGFKKNNPFFTIFTMLSVYAHSEGLSAIQLNAAVSDPSFQAGQAKVDIHNAQLLTCMMISSLIKIFPILQPKFDSLADETRYDIELLTMLGKATEKALD
jgi:hypothetical protein